MKFIMVIIVEKDKKQSQKPNEGVIKCDLCKQCKQPSYSKSLCQLAHNFIPAVRLSHLLQ